MFSTQLRRKHISRPEQEQLSADRWCGVCEHHGVLCSLTCNISPRVYAAGEMSCNVIVRVLPFYYSTRFLFLFLSESNAAGHLPCARVSDHSADTVTWLSPQSFFYLSVSPHLLKLHVYKTLLNDWVSTALQIHGLARGRAEVSPVERCAALVSV